MGTLWKGGTIYTMLRDSHTVEAVYTEGGAIRDAGRLDELERTYRGKINEVRDLGGAAMFPGFVDSHMHLIGHGETFLKLQAGRLPQPRRSARSR
ncbi:amidohydrolase family protein [Paenibacillus sp. JTLBN-2024]